MNMMTKSVKSYAKINISLNVKSKREDGYHELDSIMVPIELHDSIVVSRSSNNIDHFVTVDDFSNGLIHYNLVSTVIEKLTQKYNFKERFRFYIHKVIPMQAGLGGGSSNAAFALKAVNNILKLGASNEELIEMAAPYGADIPFFINCKPSRCTGIGEKMEPITIKNNYYVLIVKPDEGCSTKEVFKVADKNPYPQVDIDKVVKALETGNDDLLAESIGNSLEEASISINPEIQNVKNFLKEEVLKLVLMSGSGSSVFALSQDKKELKKVMEKIGSKWITELTRVIK